MSFLFVILFLAAIVGVFKPYIKSLKRWHFGAAAFVFFILTGVTAPDSIKSDNKAGASKSADGSRKTAASDGDAVEKVDYTEPVLSFQSSIMDGMKGCDIAAKSLSEVATGISEGRASMDDGYAAATATESACRDSWNTISDIDVPRQLTGDAEDKAEETIDACENAAIAKQVAAGKMAKVFDGNIRPSVVQDAKEAAEAGQAGVLACVAGIFTVAAAANVDIEKLAGE